MSPRRATRDDVIAAVRALPPGTRFVGIDGFGGSGKTTLAAAIALAVPGVSVVHVDDFAGPGVPEWDWDRFVAEVAAPLRAGEPARHRVGDGWVDVAPGGVVVVEGVSATRREVGLDWDLTVWVDTPPEVRLRRALARDGEAMRARWLEDWMPSEQAYAAREQPQERVDLIVSGTTS